MNLFIHQNNNTKHCRPTLSSHEQSNIGTNTFTIVTWNTLSNTATNIWWECATSATHWWHECTECNCCRDCCEVHCDYIVRVCVHINRHVAVAHPFNKSPPPTTCPSVPHHQRIVYRNRNEATCVAYSNPVQLLLTCAHRWGTEEDRLCQAIVHHLVIDHDVKVKCRQGRLMFVFLWIINKFDLFFADNRSITIVHRR
jgi:hypothetical protein